MTVYIILDASVDDVNIDRIRASIAATALVPIAEVTNLKVLSASVLLSVELPRYALAALERLDKSTFRIDGFGVIALSEEFWIWCWLGQVGQQLQDH